MAKEPANPLNSLERTLLRNLEKVIEKGCKTFMDVGQSLMQINTERLYREEYQSFAGYCKDRWGFTRQRAFQLIEAAEVGQQVSTIVDTSTPDSQEDSPDSQTIEIPAPTREAQARELARLPEDQRATAWGEAIDAAGGGQPTAAQVKHIVDAYLAEDEEEDEEEEQDDEPEEEEYEEEEPTPEEAVKAHNNAIEAFCQSVRNVAKVKPKLDWLDHKGRWDGYFTKIKQALDTLRSAKSVVCPKCEGDGCRECKQVGFLPKLEAESVSA